MAIQTQGKFFEDSFFEDVQEKFERAIGTVLEKSGETPSLCDYMTSYRKLRQLDLKKKENQAGAISYGEQTNTIVLDVDGFKQDDIKVKDVGNNTFQITGQNGNSDSTQSFDRQFTFPGAVDMKMFTLNMSSDGILTITVPRIDNKPITDIQHPDEISSELSSKLESSSISQASNTKSRAEAQSSSSISKHKNAGSMDKYILDSSTEQYKLMTITHVGKYFEDTFFVDVRDSFQKAVSEVLEKCGEKSSLSDYMTSYRNLRQRDLKEENQAATTLFGDKEHKIVVDVYDFKGGDIKVKIIDTNRLYIDGEISTHSFHRQFTLPGLPGTVSMRLATASMSSDGILLVIIPRVEERRSSLTSQTCNIESGIGANLSNTKELSNYSKDYNLNKELDLLDNESSITTGRSMRAMKVGDSMSSSVSQVSSHSVESVKVMSYSKTSVISSSSSSTSYN